MLELIPIPEEIQEDIKEDLAVLNEGIEDLKASPFVTAPSRNKKEVFKPPPPQEQEQEQEQEEQEPCEAAETPPPRKKTARKKERSMAFKYGKIRKINY